MTSKNTTFFAKHLFFLINSIFLLFCISFLALNFLKKDEEGGEYYSSSCISLGNEANNNETKILDLFNDEYFQKISTKCSEIVSNEVSPEEIRKKTFFSFSMREKQKILSIIFRFPSSQICLQIIQIETNEAVFKMQQNSPASKNDIKGFFYENTQAYKSLNISSTFITICVCYLAVLTLEFAYARFSK